MGGLSLVTALLESIEIILRGIVVLLGLESAGVDILCLEVLLLGFLRKRLAFLPRVILSQVNEVK